MPVGHEKSQLGSTEYMAYAVWAFVWLRPRFVPLRWAPIIPFHCHQSKKAMSFFPFGFSLPTANVESNNVAELLQQQIQQEMQAFLLMQQRNSEGNSMGSTNGNSSSIFPDYVESSVWNWNLMQMQENVQQQTQAVQQDKLPEEDGPKEQKNDDKIQASPEKKEIEVLENE